MPEICQGMSVVCPGMSGFILNPKASKRTNTDYCGYAGGMSGYVCGMSGHVRVSPGVSVPLVRLNAEKTCLAGMPEVYLGMSVYVRVCPGSF